MRWTMLLWVPLSVCELAEIFFLFFWKNMYLRRAWYAIACATLAGQLERLKEHAHP